MKKFLCAAAAIGLFLGSQLCMAFPIKGNGNIISSERSVSAFDNIQIGGFGNVTYHQSSEYRVVVSIDSNLLDHIDIYTRNNTLVIGIKRWRNIKPNTFEADVYSPGLNGIAIAGMGNFTAQDKITTSSVFRARISGFGTITGDIECDRFQANISGMGEIHNSLVCNDFSAAISGAGSITVAGKGSNAKVTISGTGTWDGKDFEVNTGSVKVTGSGKAHIWASEHLDTNISGSGVVKYRGNPKIDFRGSGVGRIESEKG